jgi:RNA polymerase sigma-70 factor, ECF subfamily
LEAIYRQHYIQIYKFCYRMLGNREAALDVAQDTFLKMMNRMNHRNQPVENPQAWLYKVAGNLCLNELSKNRLHQDREKQIDTERVNHSTPETELIENEKRGRVENAISQLEPKQLMLIMMYNDGLSYREMAEATVIREQSVGKTLWRIIDGLASSIKKQDNNE